MDDVALDIPIHRSKHSSIIGRKGFMIASLSADYKVRIMVPYRQSSAAAANSGGGTANQQSGGKVGEMPLFPENHKTSSASPTTAATSPPLSPTSSPPTTAATPNARQTRN
eukprot:4349552-Ditylum_brightwellii.AAC.1